MNVISLSYDTLRDRLAPFGARGESADAAARFYVLASAVGWLAARKSIGRATFYRFRKLYRLAGLPLPTKDAGNAWCGSAAALGLVEIMALQGRRFRVVRGFGGRHPLRPGPFHQPGARGVVGRLMFDRRGWRVHLLFDDGMEEELTLAAFLNRTEPEETVCVS